MTDNRMKKNTVNKLENVADSDAPKMEKRETRKSPCLCPNLDFVHVVLPRQIRTLTQSIYDNTSIGLKVQHEDLYSVCPRPSTEDCFKQQ